MENQSLIADLVGWVSKQPRPYAEVMEAWRTSFPRLSIWEEAVDHGFLKRKIDADDRPIELITDKGRDFLRRTERKISSKRSGRERSQKIVFVPCVKGLPFSNRNSRFRQSNQTPHQ